MIQLKLGTGLTWPAGFAPDPATIITVEIAASVNAMTGDTEFVGYLVRTGMACNMGEVVGLGSRTLLSDLAPPDLAVTFAPSCAIEGTCSAGHEEGEYEMKIGDTVTVPQLNSAEITISAGTFVFHDQSSFIDSDCNRHAAWAAFRKPA